MQKLNSELRQYNYMLSEIDNLYHEIAVKFGISDSVQRIIYIVCDKGNRCLQSDIYKQSGISRQTTNSAIRQLEKEDIVYLEHGKGRNTIVCLTEKGQNFAKEKIEPLYKIENEIFEEWTKEEIQTYLNLTLRYRDTLKSKIKELFL